MFDDVCLMMCVCLQVASYVMKEKGEDTMETEETEIIKVCTYTCTLTHTINVT